MTYLTGLVIVNKAHMSLTKELNHEVKEMAKKANKAENVKWHNAESVIVRAVELIRNPNQKDQLKGVNFVTSDNRSIMYYPVTKVSNVSEFQGFKTSTEERKQYLLGEFIINQKMLLALNNACKKEMQETVMSFREHTFLGKVYYTISEKGFKLIAWKGHDTENEFNAKIEEMKTQATKAQLEEEMPMDN